MPNLTYKNLKDTANQYDLILFDLWGVVIEGDKIYDGVIDAINDIAQKTNIAFLSNAPCPNFLLTKKLTSWGLKNVWPEKIFTSGDIARDLITEKTLLDGKAPNIYHLGKDRNDDLLIKLEHNLIDDINNADILLLSLYRDENEDINEFNDLLEQAAKRSDLLIICSNPDTTIPKNGTLRYCAGYFAKKIESFGSNVVYSGKPKTIIYDKVLKENKNIKPNSILMVGDTFETDILGARNAAIASALVLTGNAKKFHEMHSTMDDKLAALYKRAKAINIIPSFVTQIAP